MYLLTPYLASVNNLSSAIVKTVDKTMKITYTLTEGIVMGIQPLKSLRGPKRQWRLFRTDRNEV